MVDEANGEADSDSKDRLRNGNGSGLQLGSLICTLNSKMAPPPPPPPPPPPSTALPIIDTSLPHSSAAIDQSFAQAIGARTKNRPTRSESWEPLDLVCPLHFSHISYYIDREIILDAR